MTEPSPRRRDDELERSDIEAVLETRRELGLRYDTELVDGFADRIERAIDARVADEIADRRRAEAARASAGPRQLALAIVSMVAMVPISIPLALNDAFVALLVTLAAVVAVNVAHAWQSKR